MTKLIHLTSWSTGAVIYQGQFETVVQALAAAIKDGAKLRGADLRGADLRGANLDFSVLSFSCKTLSTKFDQKQITQILYHAAKPTENNKLEIDEDLKNLLSSDLFKKVVNKFHRVEKCGMFEGPK